MKKSITNQKIKKIFFLNNNVLSLKSKIKAKIVAIIVKKVYSFNFL